MDGFDRDATSAPMGRGSHFRDRLSTDGDARQVQKDRQTIPPLAAGRFVWQEPNTIAPRQWLLGTAALKGYITLLVAPGGVGKTTFALTACLSVATGRPLLGDYVFQQSASWIFNLEDPLVELHRRVAAAMVHHRIPTDEVEGRLFLNSGRERRVTIASLGGVDGLSTRIVFPDKEAIIAEAREHAVGLIVVDPFINTHELDENSNPQMNAAARAWAEVANDADCAVILVHHTRKGMAGMAGDIEGGRGAKALADACRVGLTLTAMAPEEAERCGVPAGEHGRYVRLDDGKQSMASKARSARWFRLVSVHLGNATADYPSGDSVQVIEPWTAPSVFGDLSEGDLNATLDLIDAGFSNGQRHTRTKAGPGGGRRWVGHVLTEKLSRSEEQAKSILKAWFASGLLKESTYDDPEQRRPMTGVFVDASRRPGR